jgi:hypothetical protein
MAAEFTHSFHIVISFQWAASLLTAFTCHVVCLWVQCAHEIRASCWFECFGFGVQQSLTKNGGYVRKKNRDWSNKQNLVRTAA